MFLFTRLQISQSHKQYITIVVKNFIGFAK